jgi:hypothetical protein
MEPLIVDFWNRFRQAAISHAIYFGVPCIVLVLVTTAALWYPAVDVSHLESVFLQYLSSSILSLAIGLTLVRIYRLALVEKSVSPLKDFWNLTGASDKDQPGWFGGLAAYFAFTAFMFVFLIVKVNISIFNPFSWDLSFSELDRALHFGVLPWELLQPIFGNDFGTLILSLNYNLWFVVMLTLIIHYAFFEKIGVRRTRFFLSFMVTWAVGGGAFAILFSSAGPCYFEELNGPQNPYAPLMAGLRDTGSRMPIWSLNLQDMLWRAYENGAGFAGISAMPSMHNATTLLFVLATWHGNKIWRNFIVVHALLVFFGSIHLGWHYAVDAYAAWLITGLVWWSMKPVATYWESREKTPALKPIYGNA